MAIFVPVIRFSECERKASLFWAFVDKRGAEECWPWKGYRIKSGYGHYRVPAQEVGSHNIGAHRIAYVLANRVDLDNSRRFCICHRCDNPPCVNPAHLFLGTPTQNTHDAIRKGRRFGSHFRNPKYAPVTDQIIREALATAPANGRLGMGLKGLSEKYGVSHSSLVAAMRRRRVLGGVHV